MARCAIAAGALLALAGCQAPYRVPWADTEPRPGAEAAAVAVAPSSAARAPAPGQKMAAAAPSSAARAPAPRQKMAAVAPSRAAAPVKKETPPEIDSDPRRLLGLDRARLTALLGAPEFLRSDAPAELWRYRARHCMLDLFLYTREGGASGPLTVRHYKARTTDNFTIAARRCLEALLRARLEGTPG